MGQDLDGVTTPASDLRQACPYKPRLTLCGKVIVGGQSAHKQADEERPTAESSTGVWRKHLMMSSAMSACDLLSRGNWSGLRELTREACQQVFDDSKLGLSALHYNNRTLITEDPKIQFYCWVAYFCCCQPIVLYPHRLFGAYSNEVLGKRKVSWCSSQ